ncbi:hypothetical protein [Hoylesella loescheii]|jgi:hypothetical protein|uniref:hypothetical protein n=1 Tax=Hoylesella loescheii TaxID=840 RepID=UPI00248F3566|nr:hypothetical protein [Hoylesella loescheii]
MSEYVKMGANVICTYMTRTFPARIGPTIRFCPTISGQDKPILRVIDCKISDCLACRLPQMKWGGLIKFFAAVALVACVVALAIVTGGAAVAVGAVLLGATSATVAAATAISIGVTTAALCTYANYKLGYELEHLCDETLGGRWKLGHNDTIIESEEAILDHSFLQCPNGGLISIIADDALAQQAAKKISEKNQEIVSIELYNQMIQGIVSGLTGGATPVGFAVSLILKPIDGTFGTAGGYLYQAGSTAYGGYEIKEGHNAIKNATDVVKRSRDTAAGAAKGAERAAAEAAKRKAAAETAEVVSEKQAANIQRGVNAAIKKAGRATVASEKAAANTEKAIKNAAATKKQFKLNIKSFALGIVGWAVNESLNRYYANEEKCLSDSIDEDLKIMFNQYKHNGNVVSNE